MRPLIPPGPRQLRGNGVRRQYLTRNNSGRFVLVAADQLERNYSGETRQMTEGGGGGGLDMFCQQREDWGRWNLRSNFNLNQAGSCERRSINPPA